MDSYECKHDPPCPLPGTRYGEGYHAARDRAREEGRRAGIEEAARRIAAERAEEMARALERLEDAFTMARLPTDDRHADILDAAADVVAEFRRTRSFAAYRAPAGGGKP